MAGILGGLASTVGATEPALRLLFTILAGYPVALIHRHYYYGKSAQMQHLFFAISGFMLGFYNFGFDMFHTTANMLIVYCILKFLGGSLFTAVLILVINMSYLLIGYIVTETDSYDIVWTMPHCILALRLSGLGFDVYDGTLDPDTLSKESKKCALKEPPSILELAAYTYFPTAFIVGPQFPLARYRDFVAGKCKQSSEAVPDTVGPALNRFGFGVLFLILHTYGISVYDTEWLLTDEFREYNYLARITIVGLWAHIVFYKYISCWLICEGSCILVGISYNGKDSNGQIKWDGCANVDIYIFETSQNFSKDYVRSFNINTNNWVLQYVYKRLKFLGNKYYSQFGVLLFLAVWHGFHSGYYMSFLLEFVSVAAEKDFESLLNKKGQWLLNAIEKPGIKLLLWIILKYYALVVMGPCLAPFVMLSFSRWWQLHKSVWFLPHVIWMGYPLYKPLIKKMLGSHSSTTGEREHQQ